MSVYTCVRERHNVSINYLNCTEEENKENYVSEDCGFWLVAGRVLLWGFFGVVVLFLIVPFGLETVQFN